MLPRTCAALLLLLSACATTGVNPRKEVASDRRISNLRRAATLPWVDDGRCAVREASGEWPVLVERCFHALDLGRIRFRDVTGKGGDKFHNHCADNVPGNAFPGADVLVNGKAFDALQPLTRTLWEVKTDDFDNYSSGLKEIVIRKQVKELRREHRLAQACGFEFRIGVRSAAHKAALESGEPQLKGLIVVMDWC